MKKLLKIFFGVIFFPITVLILIWKSKKSLIGKVILSIIWLAACAGFSAGMKEGKQAAEAPAADVLTIKINTDDANEYSKELTLNAGTEFELTYLGFFVPAGDYDAKNTDTKYVSQISVMSEEIHVTEEGWEEAADVAGAYAIKAGETVRITVPEGYYVKPTSPKDCILTAVKLILKKTETLGNGKYPQGNTAYPCGYFIEFRN